MDQKEILKEIIIGYRRVISDRYNHASLSEKYELPASFDESKVELFKDYFLEHIYPTPEKREELNEAFDSLDGFIKNPEKLLRILMDSAMIIFKYGRHLPKILRAGIKALKSFRTATQFENRLVAEAISIDLQPPYHQTDIETLMSALSSEEIENFIQNSQTLFETIHDRKLIKKIIAIVDHLISKMKSRGNLYSQIEINGLEIGREIISEGDSLFEQLSEKDQKLIFDFVIKIERDALENVV